MKTHKTKKLIALVTVFAMLLCFTSCGDTDQQGGTEPDPKPDYSNVVTEMYSEEGNFEDLDGNKWEYSYKLPKINLDSEDAEKINTEIDEAFGQDIKNQLQYIEAKEMPEILKIEYESYIDSDMLSLVIKRANLWDDYTYMVYNFDLLENKKMTVDEVVERVGYNGEYLDENIKKAAVREFDISHAGYFEEYFDAYTLERRAFTGVNCYLSDDFVFNASGELRTIVCLGSLAGSDQRTQDVPIPEEYPVAEGSPEQCNFDFVWAMLTENNEVHVSFEDTPASHHYMDDGIVDYGDYKVEGCLSRYKKIMLGTVGESMNDLYLFLLTEEGHVEYVDIMQGFIRCGALCNGGPLSGLKGIVDLEGGTALNSIGGSYETVYAITSSGEKIDIMESLYEAQTTILTYLDGTMTGEAGHNRIYLEYKEKAGEISIAKEEYDNGISERYIGSVRVLGMTDTGLCYAIFMTNEETNETSCGSIEIPYDDDSIYDYDHYHFRWKSGENFFDTKDTVSFTRSYG